MNGILCELNVGAPRALHHGRVVVQSGIDKTPVAGACWLGEAGLAGDTQVDRRNHGGPDKAVCVYPSEHFAYWSERLGVPIGPGGFGGNFTTVGLDETTVHIGDVYRVGETLVQVSQPRAPCFKLAARHRAPRLPLWVQQTGWSGFYLRCLRPGWVRAGDRIELVRQLDDRLSIADANRILYGDMAPERQRMLAEAMDRAEGLAGSLRHAPAGTGAPRS